MPAKDTLEKYGYYGAALGYSNVLNTEGLLGLALSGTRTAIVGVGFGFTKDSSENVSVSLILRDTDDSKRVYPIVSAEAGKTYIALMEIDINAGTDGREVVRAMIQDCATYSPVWEYAKLGEGTSVEVEAIGTSKAVTHLFVTGKMYAGGGIVKVDELAMATTADDLVYIKSAAGSKTVMVAGNPSGIGTPDPDYGTVSDVEVGTTFSCGDDFFKDGVMHSCTGYTYETRDEQGAWSEPQFVDEKTYVLDDSADTVRITWQWAPVAYRVAVTMYGSGSESVTFSADPVAPLKDGEGTLGGYFAAGEELSVSAVDGTGPDPCEFLSWSGDVESNERTIVVTPSAPLALVANFKTHWKYDSEKGELSDGNWTLGCAAYKDADITVEGPLAITGATAGSGVLDLAAINTEISGGTVKAIDANAFKSRADLVGLELSPDIVFVGESAFDGCGIANLPDFSHLVHVEKFAFQYCANMRGQPDFSSLRLANVNAFNGCSGLAGDLILPKLEKATNYLFQNCGFDGILSAPEVTSTGGFAFYNLNITSASLPKLAVVGGNSFRSCAKMTSIVLSSELSEFQSGAFVGCSQLVDFSPSLFPATMTNVGRVSLQNVNLTGLDIVLPKGFNGLEVNENNESGAFESAKMRSVDFSASAITQLPKSILRNCTNLESVSLPATVNQIDAQAFGAANAVDKLLVVDFAGDVPATVSDDWANYPDGGNPRANRDWKMVIRVPAKVADSWMADSHFVPLKDIPDVKSKPNYDRLGEFKRVVGAWRNMWLSVVNKGMVITFL